MRHHHDHTPRIQPLPDPKIPDQLWGIQERLHDIARRLDRPGPHGAQDASDIYGIIGALKVSAGDIEEIIRRAGDLLFEASEYGLTSRPCGYDDSVWLGASEASARTLAGTLNNAHAAISDIGGHLSAPTPPATPPRN